MMPRLCLLVILTLLAACEQYREPRANCFSFVAAGPVDCTFSPLPGPEIMNGRR